MPATSSERIPLAEPVLLGNARSYLLECLDTNFVSSIGPFVERFEREFAERVGSRYAVACASGTAAIHVAMRLLDIGPQDDVIVPTLTFIASANPVLYERANLVLVDVERRTWNLDPDLVIAEIERRARLGRRQVRAVEVVHILGRPAEVGQLAEVCERHGVALIEDAAESLGAIYTEPPHPGRSVGTIGVMGCFSFNGNKVITAGGGGMMVTDDEALARRAKHLTTQARLPGLEYDHDEIGYNYRLTNLAAALGLSQLEEISTLLARKRAIAERYDRDLIGIPGLQTPPHQAGAEPSHWLYTVLIDERVFGLGWRDVHLALRGAAIDTRPIWAPLHRMRPYRDAPLLGSGAAAESVFDQALSLPSSANLTEEQQDRVIEAIRGVAGSPGATLRRNSAPSRSA
jgi:dTDP-4-amino-4,6-dideoxygalactose transaminase